MTVLASSGTSVTFPSMLLMEWKLVKKVGVTKTNQSYVIDGQFKQLSKSLWCCLLSRSGSKLIGRPSAFLFRMILQLFQMGLEYNVRRGRQDDGGLWCVCYVYGGE